MLPNNIEYFINERISNLLSEADHHRLVKAAGLQSSNRGVKKVTIWFGSQMVKWGSKLQGDISTPVSSVNISQEATGLEQP